MASILMVATTAEGAVQAIAVQLHVVGLSVTTISVSEPPFAPQSVSKVFTVKVATTCAVISLGY